MPSFDAVLGTTAFNQDPYPFYAELRRQAPIYWCEPWHCWIVSRYAEVMRVLPDFEHFSNRGRVTNVIQKAFPDEFLAQIQPLLHHFSKGLINVDPPDHTRLRRLVQKTFLPKTLERLKPFVESVVDGCLKERRDGLDLVQDLAFALPIQVIARLLGVPFEMGDHFKIWSTTLLEFQAMPNPPPETVLRSQEALLAMRDYFRETLRERRRQPREDLISELVQVEEQGDNLTEDELLSTAVGLLVAGHETTTHLIGTTVWLLSQHRDQLALLQARPGLLGSAIEESLRFESPLQRLGRTVLGEVTLAGVVIQKGQTVLSLLGSANRDEAQFPEPDRFLIERTPNRHIAFGHGIHFCLGAALARLEAPIALRLILEHYPELPLQTRAPVWHNGALRGIRSLRLGR